MHEEYITLYVLTRLLEVDDGATGRDGVSQQTRIVGGPSRDKGKTLHAIGGGGNIGHGSVELNAVFRLGLFSECGELGTTGS